MVLSVRPGGLDREEGEEHSQMMPRVHQAGPGLLPLVLVLSSPAGDTRSSSAAPQLSCPPWHALREPSLPPLPCSWLSGWVWPVPHLATPLPEKETRVK